MKHLKHALLLFCLLCSSAFASSFSLIDYTSQQHNIGNISFPRNGQVSYRGVEPKLYSFTDAISAIFGDKTKNVESMLMSAIKYELMGEINQPEHSYILYKTRGDWWRKNKAGKKLEDIIDETISSRGNLSETEAILLSKKLLDESFFHQKALDNQGTSFRTIPNRILDYKSVNYSDFPRDVVFTSYYQRTATIYGAGIIVLQENKNNLRSIDLTFWNFLKNAYWKGGADAGEILFPGYIESNEVIGYELHTRGNYPDKTLGGVRISQYGVQKEEPISIAMYKHVYNNEVFILVFDGIDKDGNKRQCIRKGLDHKYYFCLRNEIVESFNPPPALTWSEANLMGVIRLCPLNQSCKRPDQVFNQFDYFSSRPLPVLDQYGNGLGHGDISSKIQNLRINGQKVQYFQSPR